MMRASLLLIALPLLCGAAHAQTATKLCELLRHPDKYEGKLVKVRATFRYGYEWEQFYCLDCLDKGKAWLTIPSEIDDESDKVFRKMPKGAGIVNVTVTGIFHFGSSYGHMNGYRYEVIAQQIRDVAVIQKGMRPLAEESKAEQQSACGGIHPR